MKTIMYSFMLSLITLASCGNRANNFDTERSESIMAADLAPPPPPAEESHEMAGSANKANESSDKQKDASPEINTPAPMEKISAKIKKTAYLNITVDDYKKARIAIEKIIKSGNGYIGNEHEQNNTYSITNDMVIRVVNKDFDAMVTQLLTVASNVNSKNISAEDVTAQFVDIQSRLRSKKEIEKRYLDILQKADKVSDILQIQQKLGEIREEIEAKEGELKYLADQVDYSTINLNFHQEFEYTSTDKPGFFGRMGSAFGNGWSGFLTFVIGFVYAWPLWIILGLTAYFIVRFIKRQLKKKN